MSETRVEVQRTWTLPFCDDCGHPQFHWRGWPEGRGHVTPCVECGSRNASRVKVGELERLEAIACQTDQEARERAAERKVKPVS